MNKDRKVILKPLTERLIKTFGEKFESSARYASLEEAQKDWAGEAEVSGWVENESR
jgi:hypothetical protein